MLQLFMNLLGFLLFKLYNIKDKLKTTLIRSTDTLIVRNNVLIRIPFAVDFERNVVTNNKSYDLTID